jgi:hypothetical protein
MKIIGITLLFILVMGIGACSTKSEVTTPINNTTNVSSSTVITSESNSTRSLFEILAAANAEVATVKIANQAYATEHDGKYASSSNQLTKYINGTPDATYYFNTDSGAITKAVNGSGITKPFHWDSAAQKWKE